MGCQAASLTPSVRNPEGLSDAAWHRLYADDSGRLAFYRTEDRHSSRGRELDCGHRIDRGEPYRYAVGKVCGDHGLFQSLLCDVCRREGNRY